MTFENVSKQVFECHYTGSLQLGLPFLIRQIIPLHFADFSPPTLVNWDVSAFFVSMSVLMKAYAKVFKVL